MGAPFGPRLGGAASLPLSSFEREEEERIRNSDVVIGENSAPRFFLSLFKGRGWGEG
jgi:hypothetical protein